MMVAETREVVDIDTGSAPRCIEIRGGDLRFTVAGGTDRGVRYAANFDVLHIEPPLLAVADGMGDGEGSAAAGRTTVDVLASGVRAATGAVGPPQLRAAVARAQREVRAIGDRLGQLAGCTLTAMVTGADGDPHAGWIAHIGDSRAYRLRAGLLELLTVDHTAAWLGAIYGWYPADSPAAARARYHLTRYVGHPDLPEPDILNVSFRPGDVYCLCTDGLAEQVGYHRLAELLGAGGGLSEVVHALLGEAMAAGGRDNATVVLVRAESASAP
ncbi:MAG TPA: protein phosphatase 2C domain-containing protein [Planosporangium sp.]|jgi:serine/threonine protein phosphatase PrpC|nr:protein phosphatase 2C domain-containing protein [Planosporangium sp.]